MSIFRCLYDYQPQADGELPFVADDYLIITNSSDADWWDALNLDGTAGVVPASYLEQAAAVSSCAALYDYAAQEAIELSVAASEFLSVYHQLDENWLLVSADNGSGLVPLSYTDYSPQSQPEQPTVEIAEPVASEPLEASQADQKSKLIAALEGLGPAPIYKPVASPSASAIPEAEYAPNNVKYFPVTVF
jgi:hypothetical protein